MDHDPAVSEPKIMNSNFGQIEVKPEFKPGILI
jgi:hypothetical protein